MSKFPAEENMEAHVAKWKWPSMGEWWQALRFVLLTFTFIVALTMAGSFVSYHEVLAQGHPWLPRFHCPGCNLCGMTRSFVAMSHGLWSEAWRWNHGGPVLYWGGWIWLSGSAFIAGQTIKRNLAGNV